MKWRSFLTFLVVGMGATAVSPQAQALPSLPMIEPGHDPRMPVVTAVATPLDMDRVKVEKAGHRYYCRYYRRLRNTAAPVLALSVALGHQ